MYAVLQARLRQRIHPIYCFNTHDILWWCLDMFKPSVLPCCKSLQVCSLLQRAMGTPTTWWVRWETKKKSTDVLFRIPCAVSHRLQPSSMILRTCARTQLMKVTMLFSWVDHQIRCQICEVAQERPDGNYIWHASLVLLYYLQATCRVGVPIRRATQKSDSSRFRVSGFGFRVSSLETNFRCQFRVSGFGFRRLKPTFAVAFGFRVSIGPGEVKSSESVSGFGFRVSIGPGEGKSSESVSGFGFRVSGFGFRSALGKLSLRFRVSGFGFRVSSLETNFRCRFRVSGFGFRASSIETHFRCRFRVSGFGFRSALGKLSLQSRFRVSGFGFRVSGFVAWNQLSLSVSGFGFRVSGFDRSWGR